MDENKNKPYVEYLEAMGLILASQNPPLANVAPAMPALLFGISNQQPLSDNGGNSLATSASYTMNVGMQQQQTTDSSAAGAAAQTLRDFISRSQNNQSGNQEVDLQSQSPQLASHIQSHTDPSIEHRQHSVLGVAHSSGQNSFPPTFQPQQVLALQQTNQSAVGVDLGHPLQSNFPPRAYFPPRVHDGDTPPEKRVFDTLATIYGLGNPAIPLVGASLPFAANLTLYAPESPDVATGCTVEVLPYITSDGSTQTGHKKRPRSGDSQNSDDCSFNVRKGHDKKPCARRRSYSAVLFAEKLFKMVTDQEASGKRDVVEFLDGGGGFWLHNPDAIPALMAKYNFRGTKFSGFRRQLTSYGFRVDRNEGPEKGAFKNPLFSRGRPDLCRRIFRESCALKESQEYSDGSTMLDHGQH